MTERFFNDWAIPREIWEMIRPLLRPGMRTLETGSGLSTLLFEAAGCRHTALEHNREYAAPCESVVISPLTGKSRWYEWQPPDSHSGWDLILIDGPAGMGSRAGILDVIDRMVHPGTRILLDDVNRNPEDQLASRIASQLGMQRTDYGTSGTRRFALLTYPDNMKKETCKVSIITRARNRLEYTIRCIDAVARNSHGVDYEHIIINQDCTDGTREWLDWISQHGGGEYFSRVRAVHLNENRGDWGGMLHGGKLATGEYIVQLDNDAEVPQGWLDALMEVMDRTDYKTSGLRILGSEQNKSPGGNASEIVREDGSVLKLEKRPYVTCCWMCRTEDFHSVATTQRNCRDACRAMAGPSCRIMNLCVTELDSSVAETDRRLSLSQVKYPRTNSQVWEKL